MVGQVGFGNSLGHAEVLQPVLWDLCCLAVIVSAVINTSRDAAWLELHSTLPGHCCTCAHLTTADHQLIPCCACRIPAGASCSSSVQLGEPSGGQGRRPTAACFAQGMTPVRCGAQTTPAAPPWRVRVLRAMNQLSWRTPSFSWLS